MNSKQFFEKVSMMRAAQKDYFRTRTYMDLRRSKTLEREIDDEIERVNKLRVCNLSKNDNTLFG